MKKQTKIRFIVGFLITLVSILSLCVSCRPKPDFYTLHGTAVYTNDIPGLTEIKVEKGLEFFAINFPKIIEEVSEEEIRDILRKTTLTWKPGPFKCWLHTTNDWGLCDGTQLGYKLHVRWTGYIQGCSLFHELAHEVMEFTQKFIDYKHERKDWWDAVQTLKHHYSKLGIE